MSERDRRGFYGKEKLRERREKPGDAKVSTEWLAKVVSGAKYDLDRLAKEVKLTYEKLKSNYNQDKLPQFMNIMAEIETAEKEHDKTNEALKNVTQGDTKIVEIKVRELNRLIGSLERKFVRLFQTYTLRDVTIIQQHVIDTRNVCRLCRRNLDIGIKVMECPECRQFFHRDCFPFTSVGMFDLTCPNCKCFVHL